MKACRDCRRTDVEFGLNKSTEDGFSHICKSCNSSRNKSFRRRLKETVLKGYGGDCPSCECCGEPTIEFLTIDHVNGGGNAHRKQESLNGAKFYTWLVRHSFPSGFRILCMNCNFSIGAFGYCPHSGCSNHSFFQLKGPAVGSRNRSSKLTDDAVRLIKHELSQGHSVYKVHKVHQVSRKTVTNIRDGVTWRHV